MCVCFQSIILELKFDQIVFHWSGELEIPRVIAHGITIFWFYWAIEFISAKKNSIRSFLIDLNEFPFYNCILLYEMKWMQCKRLWSIDSYCCLLFCRELWIAAAFESKPISHLTDRNICCCWTSLYSCQWFCSCDSFSDFYFRYSLETISEV